MFIPLGKTVYENLATSYILVDALVDDLCAEGFSGFVKVALSGNNAHVLLDRGKVAAVLAQQGASDYADTTVAELAKQARRERGGVSIYRFPAGVAAAIARSRTAEPLYLHLSSDFADLGKMIAKLGREQDREWFIRVNLTDGPAALVHLKDGNCRVIRPGGEVTDDDTNSLDPSANTTLRDLLSECDQAGCVFDVHFKRAAESPEQSGDAAPAVAPDDRESAASEESATTATGDEAGESEAPTAPDPELSLSDEAVATQPDAPVADESDELPAGPEPVWAQVPQEMPPDPLAASAPGDVFPTLGKEDFDASEVAQEAAVSDGDHEDGREVKLPLAAKRLMTTGDLRSGSQDEAMAEVKRLMGEVARTIEDAIRITEQRDRFTINLREGQLKVADQYSFLDPFGAEFEYLAGEIVFVGKAHPSEFIAGLTEALKIAVAGAINFSAQSARLRARIAGDLQDLLERNREDFERFGLDHAIEQIVT